MPPLNIHAVCIDLEQIPTFTGIMFILAFVISGTETRNAGFTITDDICTALLEDKTTTEYAALRDTVVTGVSGDGYTCSYRQYCNKLVHVVNW